MSAFERNRDAKVPPSRHLQELTQRLFDQLLCRKIYAHMNMAQRERCPRCEGVLQHLRLDNETYLPFDLGMWICPNAVKGCLFPFHEPDLQAYKTWRTRDQVDADIFEPLNTIALRRRRQLQQTATSSNAADEYRSNSANSSLKTPAAPPKSSPEQMVPMPVVIDRCDENENDGDANESGIDEPTTAAVAEGSGDLNQELDHLFRASSQVASSSKANVPSSTLSQKQLAPLDEEAMPDAELLVDGNRVLCTPETLDVAGGSVVAGGTSVDKLKTHEHEETPTCSRVSFDDFTVDGQQRGVPADVVIPLNNTDRLIQEDLQLSSDDDETASSTLMPTDLPMMKKHDSVKQVKQSAATSTFIHPEEVPPSPRSMKAAFACGVQKAYCAVGLDFDSAWEEYVRAQRSPVKTRGGVRRSSEADPSFVEQKGQEEMKFGSKCVNRHTVRQALSRQQEQSVPWLHETGDIVQWLQQAVADLSCGNNPKLKALLGEHPNEEATASTSNQESVEGPSPIIVNQHASPSPMPLLDRTDSSPPPASPIFGSSAVVAAETTVTDETTIDSKDLFAETTTRFSDDVTQAFEHIGPVSDSVIEVSTADEASSAVDAETLARRQGAKRLLALMNDPDLTRKRSDSEEGEENKKLRISKAKKKRPISATQTSSRSDVGTKKKRTEIAVPTAEKPTTSVTTESSTNIDISFNVQELRQKLAKESEAQLATKALPATIKFYGPHSQMNKNRLDVLKQQFSKNGRVVPNMDKVYVRNKQPTVTTRVDRPEQPSPISVSRIQSPSPAASVASQNANGEASTASNSAGDDAWINALIQQKHMAVRQDLSRQTSPPMQQPLPMQSTTDVPANNFTVQPVAQTATPVNQMMPHPETMAYQYEQWNQDDYMMLDPMTMDPDDVLSHFTL